MKTLPIVRKMLRENTGSHFLDSGGIYGYQYDRPISRLSVRPDVTDGEVNFFLVNAAHYLSHNLIYDEALDRKFAGQCRRAGHSNIPYEDELLEFAEEQGLKIVNSGYTYNDDTALDRDFAWWFLTPEGLEEYDDGYQPYVVIRSHNGCDARGGFSKPRFFRPYGEDGAYDWNFGGPDKNVELCCPACQDEADVSLPAKLPLLCGQCGAGVWPYARGIEE